MIEILAKGTEMHYYPLLERMPITRKKKCYTFGQMINEKFTLDFCFYVISRESVIQKIKFEENEVNVC